MCSCSKKRRALVNRLPDIHTVNDWLSSHLSELVNMTTISESALTQGEIKTILLWVRCVDPQALVDAFLPYDIGASTDAQIDILADAAITGKDVQGFYKYPMPYAKNPSLAGQPRIFDVRKTVGNIKITSDKFQTASCSIVYSK